MLTTSSAAFRAFTKMPGTTILRCSCSRTTRPTRRQKAITRRCPQPTRAAGCCGTKVRLIFRPSTTSARRRRRESICCCSITISRCFHRISCVSCFPTASGRTSARSGRSSTTPTIRSSTPGLSWGSTARPGTATRATRARRWGISTAWSRRRITWRSPGPA